MDRSLLQNGCGKITDSKNNFQLNKHTLDSDK